MANVARRAWRVAARAPAAAVHPPFAKYSLAGVVEASSRLILCSGQLGIKPDGEVPTETLAQARVCFGNLGAVLEAEGASLADVVRVNAFVTGREHMRPYMQARDEAFEAVGTTPASTLVVVSGFTRPEFTVEVEATAAVASRRKRRRGCSWTQRRRAVNHKRRHLSSGASATQLARFRADVEASGAKAILATDGDNQRRECLRRSRDYYWYSPILKKQLDSTTAQAVVAASTEAHVLAAAKAAVAHGVPLIPRGAGTGNYGQVAALKGGAILDVSNLSGVVSIDTDNGTCVAWAGTKLSELEDAAREVGYELRQHPSTRREATIGGFVAGGSTGHGALLHGGLSEDGAVLGLRVVTAEPEPRVLELKGPDVFPVVHAYGTNGVISQVEIPLARAQPWHDALFAFDTLADAAAFALDAANAPSVVARAVSVWEAPVPFKYLELPAVPDEATHAVMVQCTRPGIGPLERIASRRSGRLAASSTAETTVPRPMHLNGWNHTTLHALKKDKSLTYLQAALSPDRALSAVDLIQKSFPSTKLLQHLECINMGGRVGFAALSILWPSDDDDLRSIMRWHEDAGIPVFDPHVYTVEGGGMKETDWAQLDFKLKADPGGLLNPGKLASFDDPAAVSQSASTVAAMADAYRLGVARSTEPTQDSKRAKQAPPRSRYWRDWTTEAFSEADLSKAVAVLPIGAVEAHGPHLPLGTDAMHNEALLDAALDLLPPDVTVLALPQAQIGVSCEHSAFAGTLQLSSETALACWLEIAGCVKAAGVDKLVLYNSHGGNHPLAEVVARRVRHDYDMLCVLAMNLGSVPACVCDLFPRDEQKYGIHGGALETSLMLALRPDLVNMDKAKDFASSARDKRPTNAALQIHQPGFANKAGWLAHDLNPHGVVGAAAALSDSAKGKALADASARAFADLLLEVHAADVSDLLGSTSMFPPQGPPVGVSAPPNNKNKGRMPPL